MPKRVKDIGDVFPTDTYSEGDAPDIYFGPPLYTGNGNKPISNRINALSIDQNAKLEDIGPTIAEQIRGLARIIARRP
jgi:hypothetical protein